MAKLTIGAKAPNIKLYDVGENPELEKEYLQRETVVSQKGTLPTTGGFQPITQEQVSQEMRSPVDIAKESGEEISPLLKVAYGAASVPMQLGGKVAAIPEFGNNLLKQAKTDLAKKNNAEKYNIPADSEIYKSPFLTAASPARRMMEDSYKSRETATEGLNPLLKETVNFGLDTLDLAADLGISRLTGIPLAGMQAVTSGVQSGQQALDEGYSAKQAGLMALGSGAISGAVESLGGFGATAAGRKISEKVGQGIMKLIPEKIANYLAKAGNTGIGEWFKSSASESLEEFGEYYLQTIYENLILDKDTPLDIKEAAVAALKGFAMAGLINAPGQIGRSLRGDKKTGAAPDIQAEETPIKRTDLYNDELKGMFFDPAYQSAEMDNFQSPLILNRETGRYETKAEQNRNGESKYQVMENPEPLKVGKVTTIQSPYQGKIPQNGKTAESTAISDSDIARAAGEIEAARKTDKFTTTIKSTLKNLFLNAGGQRKVTLSNVTFNGEPYEVNLNPNIAEKVASSGYITPEKLAVFYNLDTAIQGAEYVGSGNYNKNKPKAKNVERYDYFEKPLTIGEKPYVMAFDVEVYRDRNNMRTYRVISEIDLSPADAIHRSQIGSWVNKETGLSGTNIPQGNEGVKNQHMPADGNNTSVEQTAPEIVLPPVFGKDGSQVEGQTAKTLPDGTTIQQETQDGNALAEIKQVYSDLKLLRKNSEKISEKYPLNEKERGIVDALLKGYLKLSDIPNFANENYVNRDYVEKVYTAKKAVQTEQEKIDQFNLERKAELRKTADSLIENSDDWKDKGSGFAYSRETMERNIRDIVPDKTQADAINREYFEPVHQNEAEATRFKNRIRERVRKLDLNEYESQYTQLWGEYEYHRDNTKSAKSQKTAEDLALKITKLEEKYGSKINKEKAKSAAKVFRDIYDEIFPMINDTLVENGYKPAEYRKGYFPHFNKNTPDTIIGKIGKALGIETKNQELPTDIAGLTHTFRPGKKWMENLLQRKGEATDYGVLEGLDRYLETAGDVIYHTEDIQKLRTLENAIRYKYSDMGTQEEIDAVRANENLSEEEKQVKLTSLFEREPAHLPHLVTELRAYTDSLAGKKSLQDRTIENDAGREIYQTVQNLENRVAANMVAINPGSWITNFIPLTQGYAELSTGSMLKAAKESVKSQLVDDGFTDRSAFLTNRKGSDPLVKGTAEKVSETLAKPMYYIDSFTANTLTRARTYDNMKKGMSEAEALREADSWTASVMADRSKGSLPTVFNRKNPLTKLFTMFQVEVNNQFSYLFKDMPKAQKEKGVASLVGAFAKYFIGAYLYNELYEKLTGRRTAFDPIGMAEEAIGDFTDPNIKTSQAVTNLGENVAEEIPFVGGLLGGGRLPISSAVPDVGQLLKLADSEVDGSKKADIALKEFSKPAAYLLAPFGGGQIKKAAEGIGTVLQGGSYALNNQGERQLQYPVFDSNPANYAKGALFGKYAFDEAEDYIDSGFKKLSAKQTTAYDALTKNGVDRKAAYDTIREISGMDGAEDKREYILGLEDFTPEQKAMLDVWTVGELNKPRDYTNRETYEVSKLSDSRKEAYSAAKEQLGMDIDTFLACCESIKDIKADKDKNGNSISGSAKQKKIEALQKKLGSLQKAQIFYNILY